VDNPVDRPVDKCVYAEPVDKCPVFPQLVHRLCTIFHTFYPQAKFDTHAGLEALIHISTAPTTTTTDFKNF
jgi:hypothetical protein